MTSLGIRLQALPIHKRIVGAWDALARRWNPRAVIVMAWAVLAVPLVCFRGYYAHEGLAVSIARSALESGDWLTPYLFNIRFVERPTLQSWIIEALSASFGSVSQVTARLPSALFLLAGCFLIYGLLRKVAASIPASLLGVALFLTCPLVMRSYVMITADLPVAVTLFLAFYLWWGGNEKGSISVARWLAVGAVLAFAGLFKGPQPVGYFALGIGLYVFAARARRQADPRRRHLRAAARRLVWGDLHARRRDDVGIIHAAQTAARDICRAACSGLENNHRHVAGHAGCRRLSDC
jgi:4-amino-4-deoxy-L-arabinose transferase-like glycosyltransferase